jgi:hypothetical protein
MPFVKRIQRFPVFASTTRTYSADDHLLKALNPQSSPKPEGDTRGLTVAMVSNHRDVWAVATRHRLGTPATLEIRLFRQRL